MPYRWHGVKLEFFPEFVCLFVCLLLWTWWCHVTSGSGSFRIPKANSSCKAVLRRLSLAASYSSSPNCKSCEEEGDVVFQFGWPLGQELWKMVNHETVERECGLEFWLCLHYSFWDNFILLFFNFLHVRESLNISPRVVRRFNESMWVKMVNKAW